MRWRRPRTTEPLLNRLRQPNASLANAKTIDLCNNPLTKEPKLDQARRLGGGRWLALDSRVEDLMAIAAKDVGASTAAKDEL